MDPEIRTALRSLEQTIWRAEGPVFTDADYGRTLRAFLSVFQAMDAQDRRFKAQAAKAERIEWERERQKRHPRIDIDAVRRELHGDSDD